VVGILNGECLSSEVNAVFSYCDSSLRCGKFHFDGSIKNLMGYNNNSWTP
jgi:hypothetical protein